ncbi:DUF2955 domain-containing protein [Pseudomonas sp. NPDC098747]|uniref:DUF2955 domain-containing protein n=1 Tax=Pseudomonas sp. NPDC098747 TaxID=3364487 RepID=UPI00383BB43D
MPTDAKGKQPDLRSRRVLRLAISSSLSLVVSFGLALPLAFLAPVLAVLLATTNRPISFKAGVSLTIALTLTTGCGLVLIPVLHYFPVGGALLVIAGLFFAFLLGVRGANQLIVMFLVIGLTMISAAGTLSFAFALTVIGAMVKGLILALVALAFSHWLLPEPDQVQGVPSSSYVPANLANRMAFRATLVVVPAFFLTLINPAGFMPLILKSVSLGQQSCTTAADNAGRELIGSTLLGGLLAILFWCALSLFVHLWMLFLWMLLFSLFFSRKIYGLIPTQYGPAFWLNSLITMIILLGQSVHDSMAGKDVYSAFALRMGLFIAVTFYACFMIRLLDQRLPTTPLS